MTSHHLSTKCCFQNDDLVRLLFLPLIPFRPDIVCFCLQWKTHPSKSCLAASSCLPFSLFSPHFPRSSSPPPPPPTFAVRLQCESCHQSGVPLQYRTTQHSSQGGNSALLISTYCTLRGEMRGEMRGDGRGTSCSGG